MSSYRDDMNDTAVASDRVLTRLRSIAEDTARATSMILSTLVMLVTDTALASDQVLDRARSVPVMEHAQASDEVLGRLTARTLVQDGARTRDTALGTLRLLLQDGAAASDQVLGTQHSVLRDTARAGDKALAHRTHRALMQEQVRASDALIYCVRELAQDGAAAGDAVLARLHARALVQEGAAASDALLGAAGQSLVLTGRARAGGKAFGVLHARDLVQDAPVAAHDELVSLGALLGQVWTATTGEWAMSRWRLGLTGLAVINGVLYATTPEGVFAMDGEGEAITGELHTGAIDMTGDRLGRPHAAYLEYELAGPGAAASIAVTTTQSGVPATYTYPLALRPTADALTNARALLGRGLRGRHFAYTLKLTGSRAYINDWGVLVAPTNRRI